MDLGNKMYAMANALIFSIRQLFALKMFVFYEDISERIQIVCIEIYPSVIKYFSKKRKKGTLTDTDRISQILTVKLYIKH